MLPKFDSIQVFIIRDIHSVLLLLLLLSYRVVIALIITLCCHSSDRFHIQISSRTLSYHYRFSVSHTTLR